MTGLSVVNKEDIIIDSNGMITFKNIPKTLYMYEYNENIYSILSSLYDSAQNQIILLKVKSAGTQSLLDLTDYNSVQNTFKIATELGAKITSDKELLEYATTEMCPKKRLIKTTKGL